jgi:hypothetical protein
MVLAMRPFNCTGRAVSAFTAKNKIENHAKEKDIAAPSLFWTFFVRIIH